MRFGCWHLNGLPLKKMKQVGPRNDLFAPPEVLKEDTLTILCANLVKGALGGSYKTVENLFQGFQKECFTAIGSPNQHDVAVFTRPLN